jgi:hypothetical protein
MSKITTTDATLIVDTCQRHACTRILKRSRKTFDLRQWGKFSERLATAEFRKPHLIGFGNISDLEFYEMILH